MIRKMMMVQTPLADPLIVKRLNYHARLKKLVSHMRENISAPLSLEDAARVACMEKTAFSRFFSRTVGITFHDFVQQWRIATAAEYMLSSDFPLTEVALAVGFQTMNTFERTFKKFTGLTPSTYRRNLLLSHNILGQETVSNKQDMTTQSQQARSIPADD